MQTENRNFDIDALLRDTAQADNQALPFSDWKDALLQKAAGQAPEDVQADGTLAFAPPRKRRAISLRQAAIGLSTVAAALLVVFGMRGMQPAAPAPAPAEPAAFSMAAPAAPEANAADAATPHPDTAPLAEAAPMAPEGYVGDSQEAPASAGAAADAMPPEAGAYGAAGASSAQGRMAISPEELEALYAVQAALGLPEEEAEFAYVMLEENARYTIAPLEANAKAAELNDISIYVVILDMTAEMPPSYAVDASTMKVLGTIVF